MTHDIYIFVLIALHDVTAAVGLPVIAALAGVHLGAGVMYTTTARLMTAANVTQVTGNRVP